MAYWSCAARPNHRLRGLVTPARRGRGVKSISNAEVRSPAEHHAAMTWAQRLKRVFNIDIEVCNACGGPVKVIACIEDPVVVNKILRHLQQQELKVVRSSSAPLALLQHSRAPPVRRLPQDDWLDSL